MYKFDYYHYSLLIKKNLVEGDSSNALDEKKLNMNLNKELSNSNADSNKFSQANEDKNNYETSNKKIKNCFLEETESSGKDNQPLNFANSKIMDILNKKNNAKEKEDDKEREVDSDEIKLDSLLSRIENNILQNNILNKNNNNNK